MKKIVAVLLVLLVAGTMIFAQLYCGNADSAIAFEIDGTSVFFTNMSQSKTITVNYKIHYGHLADGKKESGIIQIKPLSKEKVSVPYYVNKKGVEFTATYCD